MSLGWLDKQEFYFECNQIYRVGYQNGPVYVKFDFSHPSIGSPEMFGLKCKPHNNILKYLYPI